MQTRHLKHGITRPTSAYVNGTPISVSRVVKEVSSITVKSRVSMVNVESRVVTHKTVTYPVTSNEPETINDPFGIITTAIAAQ